MASKSQSQSIAKAKARQRAIDLDDKRSGNEDIYSIFKKTYRNNPVGFVRDCVKWDNGEGLSDYQEEIISKIVSMKRVSARGPHGLGKTALASLVVLWFSLTRDGEDWKIPTTASAWRQLTKFLWPEIHKWARRLKWDVIGRQPFQRGVELLDNSIKLSTGEAFAMSSDNSDLIEGAHADNILYIFDEAKSIPDNVWDAAEGALGTGNAFALCISTPGEPLGRFYEIQQRRSGYTDWWVRAVTTDEAINAGRISADWVAKRKKQWGESSAMYQNRVAGNFASSDEDTVISLALVEAANERWLQTNDAIERGELDGNGEPIKWGEVTSVGVDVGRGGDPSAEAIQAGRATIELREFNEKTVMPIVGRLFGLLKKHVRANALIDVIGIGGGVYDRLQEDEYKSVRSRVVAFNASGKTEFMDRTRELGMTNLRAAMWWKAREMLEDGELDLPPNEKLTEELVAPKWTVTSGGKIRIEEKEEVRKRISRSTNYADAVLMAVWNKTTASGFLALASMHNQNNAENPPKKIVDEFAGV
jgi:hypothetical protein